MVTRVIIGGTFGFLHKGHQALISKAFAIGDHVYIGLTTDLYVRRKKHSKSLPSYPERRTALESFAKRFGKPFEIKPLNDRFGPSVTGSFDAIVVSNETMPAAMEINEMRRRRGLRPLRIARIGHSLAKDAKPISTLRIINGEIDREGNLLASGNGRKPREVIARLREMGDVRVLEGMRRFGINASRENALGVRVPQLRRLAGELGKDHCLAVGLWSSGIHEARLLASMVEDPLMIDEAQMDKWARESNSWDVCDQCCGNLFDKTPVAYEKAREWSGKREEFVKRAGFSLMAALAVHDKKADDAKFIRFLGIIRRSSDDRRNFVRKAVNWALRQIVGT